MLQDYQEKVTVTRDTLGLALASLGIGAEDQRQELQRVVEAQGEALVSHYAFRLMASEARGDLTIFHDSGRGAISFGGPSEWGDWNDTGEFLELPDGRSYTFEGKPVDEGDEGSCSLGNV